MRAFMLVVCALACCMVSPLQAAIVVSAEADVVALELGRADTNTGFFIGHRADGSSALIGTITMLDMYNGMVTQHQQFPGQFQSYSARLGVNRPNPGNFNLFNNFSQHAVSNIINHPSYGGLGRGYDFGMVHFYDGIAGIETLNIYNGERNIGDRYQFTGGGFSGVLGTTPVLDGRIRVGYNLLERLDFEFDFEGVQDAYLSFRFDAPGSANFVDGEIMPWEQDSGGNWKIFNETNQRWELDGLMALTGPPQYGGRVLATPLPRNFIQQNRFSAVPEPSSFLMLLLSSSLAAFRRLRRS